MRKGGRDSVCVCVCVCVCARVCARVGGGGRELCETTQGSCISRRGIEAERAPMEAEEGVHLHHSLV